MSFADPITDLHGLRELIDRALANTISAYACDDVPLIRDAMAYALDGGKRLRGAITLSTFKSLGGSGDAMPFALAIEMIQAYSLVHDDLPCMDDDDVRRGKPTCHRKFGEAMAVLTGDALLTLAFEIASSATLPPDRMAAGIRVLANGAGAAGMVGGQVLDLQLENRVGSDLQGATRDNEASLRLGDEHDSGTPIGPAVIRMMYRLKTGRLFETAARLGAVLSGSSPEDVSRVSLWGSTFGYAYQILDDIDDLTQGGKEDDKVTLLKMVSQEAARREAALNLRKSLEAVEPDWFLARLSRHYLSTKL